VALLLAIIGLSMALCSCSARTVKTTTTRMGITGAQETVVTETPFVDPFDTMLSDAGAALMQTEF
jgi:hypothetical protein